MSVTYQPKKRKRAKAHGFRTTTKNSKKRPSGNKIIQRRRAKGRKKLTP